jgi:hypothetical protein
VVLRRVIGSTLCKNRSSVRGPIRAISVAVHEFDPVFTQEEEVNPILDKKPLELRWQAESSWLMYPPA